MMSYDQTEQRTKKSGGNFPYSLTTQLRRKSNSNATDNRVQLLSVTYGGPDCNNKDKHKWNNIDMRVNRMRKVK